MIEKYVDYTHNGTSLTAYMAFKEDGGKPRPTVMIAHTWEGRGEFVCDKARILAAQGFVGFAIDLYGGGTVGKSVEENARLMQPLMDDRAMLQSRLHCALDALCNQPEVDKHRIAAIGYCFGGLCVLDLARSGASVRSVVSLHGLLGAPGNTNGNKIAAKILILHGNDDPMATKEDVLAIESELSEAGADWQLHTYGNTMHAFSNPNANNPVMGTVYNEVADSRSWTSLINFVHETLV
ncbi:MAG: dienelactone hydrolase [Gammaproteobacteria bacterium]|jgi:dienelactone hydrolase